MIADGFVGSRKVCRQECVTGMILKKPPRSTLTVFFYGQDQESFTSVYDALLESCRKIVEKKEKFLLNPAKFK